jgi:hypothetical protein
LAGVACRWLHPRRLEPAVERELLNFGYGITNFVNYATASRRLTREQLVAGGQRLKEKSASINRITWQSSA